MPLNLFSPTRKKVDSSPVLSEFLEHAPLRAVTEFDRNVMIKQFGQGMTLIRPGEACMHFFVVTRGRLRVFSSSEAGRELTLYHVDPGGSCMLTCWSILSHGPSVVSAAAVGDLEMALVDARHLGDWVKRYDFWRDHVQSMMLVRLGGLVRVIESLGFHSLESRLASWLIDREHEDWIRQTHQEIANELGTSREVISRLLARMKKLGLIHQERAGIRLLEPERMQALSSPEDTTL